MKINDTLKKVTKKNGKYSFSSRAISKLKSSKEFSYLFDMKRA